MTREEYKDYQSAVADFFEREGLENLSPETDEDGEWFEASFSWSPCDCCHRSLGGDRYECSGYNRDLNQVQDGYSVCVDCVYYAEYGRLDDMTMMEIEDERRVE